MRERLREAEERAEEARARAARQQEEGEVQRGRIIKLNEQLVLSKSAYNALQKHLGTTSRGVSGASSLSFSTSPSSGFIGGSTTP